MSILEQTLVVIPTASVLVNPEQPRREFNETEINDMAATILEHGVIKPIAVEECVSPTGEQLYILHDGERRLRASIVAKQETIPAIVSPAIGVNASYERLVRAVVANIQSAPMNPVDDALAIYRLRDEYGLSNRDISKQIGKAETVVSTRLQLASLDPEILDLMRAKRLSTESKVVNAFRRIPDPKDRIELARSLADQSAGADMVVSACNDFLGMKEAKNKQTRTQKQLFKAVRRRNVRASLPMFQGTPAVGKITAMRERESEWNALFQIGKVPPFSMVNDVVMTTCDNCSLRSMASEAMCGGCALVSFLRGMMSALDANKKAAPHA